MKKITFSITYHNGTAGSGQLDMYDAALSFQGFARAISITAHALVNNGEVKKKGNRAEGAELYIRTSKRGSFEQFVTLVITNTDAIGVSIAANAFYDLLKWTWSKSIGGNGKPTTPFVKRLVEDEKIEPFITEMEESLETSLEQAHRPISKDKSMVITLRRKGVGEIVRFDKYSLVNVSSTVDQSITKGIIGNVTRYNILSGYGRFYDDTLNRVVSFVITPMVTQQQKSLLTWSLYYAQEEEGGGKIVFEARRVLTAKGNLKRYMVVGVGQYLGA